jgi:hypothetical protein
MSATAAVTPNIPAHPAIILVLSDKAIFLPF